MSGGLRLSLYCSSDVAGRRLLVDGCCRGRHRFDVRGLCPDRAVDPAAKRPVGAVIDSIGPVDPGAARADNSGDDPSQFKSGSGASRSTATPTAMDRPLGASWVECVAFFVAMFVIGGGGGAPHSPWRVGRCVVAWRRGRCRDRHSALELSLDPGCGIGRCDRGGERGRRSRVAGVDRLQRRQRRGAVDHRRMPVAAEQRTPRARERERGGSSGGGGSRRWSRPDRDGRCDIAVFGEGPVLPVAVAARPAVAVTMIVVPLVLTGPRVPPRRRFEVLARGRRPRRHGDGVRFSHGDC